MDAAKDTAAAAKDAAATAPARARQVIGDNVALIKGLKLGRGPGRKRSCSSNLVSSVEALNSTAARRSSTPAKLGSRAPCRRSPTAATFQFRGPRSDRSGPSFWPFVT
jgi:hypothetical protein